MIRIKKVTFVILLVIALVFGAAGVCVYMGVNIKDFSGGTESPVLVSRDLYDDYQYLAGTYGKMDLLRSSIKDNYYVPITDEKLDDAMLHGIFDCLDNYSMYFNPEEYAQDMINATGEYSGVGMTISFDETGYIVVVSPTDDTPAYNAGIKAGDYILAVDGVEYSGEQYSEAATALRGKAGTEVKVTIRRGDSIKEYTLVRSNISLQSVKYEMLDNNIGYIRITQFMQETANKFESALKDLYDQGAEALVVDIRSNGGGMVDQSVRIADMLMEKGTVIYAEDVHGKREYYSTTSGRTPLEYVVLVDGGSASASEILCAGIQDNEEGIIVGTQTFGKGIIQEAFGLEDGSGFQMTVMQYFSPKGNAIHQIGVTPDYIVEMTEDCYDDEGNVIKDPQLDKAIELLTK